MTKEALTVTELLEETVARVPDATALVTVDVRLTYRGLRDLVGRAITVLRGLNVRRGTSITVLTTRPHDAVVTFLAARVAGARWVGINPGLAIAQQLRLAADSRSSIVLADAGTEFGAWSASRGVRHVLATTGAGSWYEATSAAVPTFPRVVVDPHAPAGIGYTSGTTGDPKGVVHSQHNITLPSRYLAQTRDFAADAVIGVVLPATALNVIAVAVLPAFRAGIPCVFVPRISACVIPEWVAREGITTMSLPPPAVIDLATNDDVDAGALATFTRPRVGGAPLSDDALLVYQRRFGRRVMRTYGLSEAPTLVACEPRGEELPSGSAGRVLPYLRVEIRAEDRKPVPIGSVGEIWISGAIDGPWRSCWTPMLGYWRNERATAATLVDGWVRTGDLGRMDEDGVLFVAGRAGGVVNRGGANIYVADVEAVLRSLPGVLDGAVVGVPDARLGERVAAAVTLSAGPTTLDEAALATACASRLARYQVPEIFVAVDELPRNGMGKIVSSEVCKLIMDRER